MVCGTSSLCFCELFVRFVMEGYANGEILHRVTKKVFNSKEVFFDIMEKYFDKFPMTWNTLKEKEEYLTFGFMKNYTVYFNKNKIPIACIGLGKDPWAWKEKNVPYEHINLFEVNSDYRDKHYGTEILKEYISHGTYYELMSANYNFKFYENIGFKLFKGYTYNDEYAHLYYERGE